MQKIDATKRFGRLLKRLDIIFLSEFELVSLKYYKLLNNDSSAGFLKTSSGFTLRECKDYVERLLLKDLL